MLKLIQIGVTPGPHSDIALIEIKAETEVLNKLIPVCLPNEDYQIRVGTRCKIMGNGFMNAYDEDRFHMPNVLQMADVHISSNQACRDEVESIGIKSKINSDVLCIRGPIHPCVGDSGGPLVCSGASSNNIQGHKLNSENNDNNYSSDDYEVVEDRWYLLGVTSFAVSTGDDDKCGSFKSAVFGKVSHHLKWIKNVISNSESMLYTPRV